MSAIEGKYGVITAEKKQFHPDEPVFLLRGTDPLAVQAIREYAMLCESSYCESAHVRAIEDHASRMEKWQRANPALVKALPD